MHPILFKIGDFAIYTYGLTMALAFLIAFGWIFYEVKRLGEPLDHYYNVCLISLVGGIAGARILYLIVNWSEFKWDLWRMINLRDGGLVWYGGVLLVVVSIWGYARLKDISFYHIADILVAPLAMGLGIGRLGCLMSGCCYGCATDLPWGVVYPRNSALPPELAGVRVHPSQLYEMLAVFGIAAILTYLQRTKKREGEPLWAFFLFYSLARFCLEYLRGDEIRGFLLPGLSTSQAISLPVFIVALVMLARLSKK